MRWDLRVCTHGVSVGKNEEVRTCVCMWWCPSGYATGSAHNGCMRVSLREKMDACHAVHRCAYVSKCEGKSDLVAWTETDYPKAWVGVRHSGIHINIVLFFATVARIDRFCYLHPRGRFF